MITEPVSPAGVLVTDFDGTMTQHDFYRLVVDELIPPGTPDYWSQYRAGTITHFECLRGYFASIQASEKEVHALVDRMEIDPNLPAAVTSLRRAGWRVIVASAGCEWYIRRLLGGIAGEVEVHSNPGRFEEGKGLLLSMPEGSPFLSPTLGVNKAGIVQHYLAAGQPVAFAGDGFPDAEPARLVPSQLRFARGDLAGELSREGLAFHPYQTWSEIAECLLFRRD